MKCALIFLLTFFVFSISYAANIEVRTHYQNGSKFPDANILVWKKTHNIDKEKPDYKFKTDKDGKTNVSLPDGTYYFFAEKKDNSSYFFGFFGLNPVFITEKKIINISLISFPEMFIEKSKKKGLSGTVTFFGKPVEDVGVYIYLDLSSELKGPPYFFTKTDENGKFHIDLDEGSFYILFKKKKFLFGPPEPGDYVSFFPYFPIIFNKNHGYNLRVELLEVPKRIKDSFEKLVRVYGTVKDKEGKPLKNVYVVAYDRDELLGKPKYVSQPTDEEGNYNIYLKDMGKFYIAVRKSLGDTPASLDEMYVYGEIEIERFNAEKKIDIIFDSIR